MKVEITPEGLLISLQKEDSTELADIVGIQMPQFLELFALKNREYGDNSHVLGVKGQFADIWRKVGKLRTALWDGEPDRLVSEDVEEVLRDLIGHCFITLNLLSTRHISEEDIEWGIRASRARAASLTAEGVKITNWEQQQR